MNKPRQPFAMKQFSIAQNDVALPVTSDACLFGSMIQLPKNAHVLDIGTGTGLLCFMLAQKHPDATFTGIDIHPGSIQQAIENNHNNNKK
jgi:tRNA1Val (adenine37-N6)-methyltransferase